MVGATDDRAYRAGELQGLVVFRSRGTVDRELGYHGFPVLRIGENNGAGSAYLVKCQYRVDNCREHWRQKGSSQGGAPPTFDLILSMQRPYG